LWDKLEHALLERLKDKKDFVRSQAVIGLARLQDPKHKGDEIVRKFIDLMRNDPSK